MLHRDNRFHGHNSLSYVYKHGRSVRCDLFGLRIAPNERRKQPRCAIVVSKKISKSAVVRNRIRRRLYEMVRTRLGVIEAPLDLVLTVFKTEVATIEAVELAKQLDSLLIKAGLMPQNQQDRRATIEAKETM